MKKNFDCVEMKHRAAKKIYEETKDMTFEQKLAYWRNKSEAMIQRRQKLIQELKEGGPNSDTNSAPGTSKS